MRSRRPAEARQLLAEVPQHGFAAAPELLLRASRVRLMVGDVSVLTEELHRCRIRLEEAEQHEKLALLDCEEGRTWDRAGDLGRARACWLRTVERCRGAVLDPVRADAFLQLGRIDHLRGHLGDALKHYQQVQSYGLPFQVQEAALRRILVLLDLGQHRSVRNEADQFLSRLSPAQLPDELQPLFQMVRLLIKGGEVADASVELQAQLAANQGDTARALESTPRPFRRQKDPNGAPA